MRTVETITKEIEELKVKLEDVRGTETEVYTRIVGYYRSLRNWNKGKKEEYAERLPFIAKPEEQPAEEGAQQGALQGLAGYRDFYRKSCPKCPAVRDFVSRLPLAGTPVDVDTEEGFAQAMANDVQSTPTVVFFDADNRARRRYNSVSQLEELLAGVV